MRTRRKLTVTVDTDLPVRSSDIADGLGLVVDVLRDFGDAPSSAFMMHIQLPSNQVIGNASYVIEEDVGVMREGKETV